MKKLTTGVLAALSTSALLMTSTANAADGGLFVEPAVTYETNSKTTFDWPAPFGDSTGTTTGLGVGARLGFHINDMFFLGADARYSQPKFEDSAVSFSADATAYNYGVTAGVQTPVVGLRVWGSYILGGEMDPKKDGSLDVKFKDATGYRVGAGFKVAVVSLNLEYQSLKYNNGELESVGPFNPGTTFSNDLTSDSYILSVSFPFAL